MLTDETDIEPAYVLPILELETIQTLENMGGRPEFIARLRERHIPKDPLWRRLLSILTIR